ncbi:MAG: hypothetical protein ACC700_20450 [Anaerolineales bacterium]
MKNSARATIWLSLSLIPTIMYAQNDENPYDRSLEPAKSFHQARELIEEGQFKHAHAIHQKMFSNIDSYRPNVFFLCVYNLTYDWHRNAQNYQPAMESMLEYRDALEKRLSKLEGHDHEPSIEDRIDLLTVFSFNEWLKEDARSADLFATIEDHYRNLADGMYFHCKDALIRAKRFSAIVRYEPDPKLIVVLAAAGLKATIDARPDLETMAKSRFETAIVDSLDAFSSVGNAAKAEELRKLALDVLDSERIRNHSPTAKANGG